MQIRRASQTFIVDSVYFVTRLLENFHGSLPKILIEFEFHADSSAGVRIYRSRDISAP